MSRNLVDDEARKMCRECSSVCPRLHYSCIVEAMRKGYALAEAEVARKVWEEAAKMARDEGNTYDEDTDPTDAARQECDSLADEFEAKVRGEGRLL